MEQQEDKFDLQHPDFKKMQFMEDDELMPILLRTPDDILPFRFWLRKRMFQWFQKEMMQGRHRHQADYAKYIGIKSYNLSQYLTGGRMPTATFAKEMAKKLGQQVFDKVGLPREIPNDPLLLWILDNLPLLPKQKQKEIVERAKNMLEEEERSTGGPTMA